MEYDTFGIKTITPFTYPFRGELAMPRAPKLRKKTVGNCVYWYTKAGGDTYFGHVDELTHKQANKLFADHLVKIRDEDSANKRERISAGELLDRFVDWIRTHRSVPSADMRKRYCLGFGRFRPNGMDGTRIADLAADKVTGEDLEGWLESLKKKGDAAQTRLHAETSVRHCWNWATKFPSPNSILPRDFRPFSAVERTVVQREALTEADLLTDDEAKAIFAAAAIEPNQFRKHGLEKTVQKKGIEGLRRTDGQLGCFADLLRCYEATGARTHELANCLTKDFLPKTRQVVLGKHKRTSTEKYKTNRQMTLNSESLAIFERHCKGKNPTDHVFLTQEGTPWNSRSLAKRFARVKEIASALNFAKVRDEITIYDFRHLWISDGLMAGNDIATIARMAGTSIAMIEKVYGHFRNEHLHDALDKIDLLRRTRRG
jgi:integrase